MVVVVEQELLVRVEPCMVGVPPVSAVLRTHMANMFDCVYFIEAAMAEVVKK